MRASLGDETIRVTFTIMFFQLIDPQSNKFSTLTWELALGALSTLTNRGTFMRKPPFSRNAHFLIYFERNFVVFRAPPRFF